MKRYVSDSDIDNITRHHPPKNDATITAHEEIRIRVNELMKFFNAILPEGPSKTHLLRVKCREILMHANSIIACEDGPDEAWVELYSTKVTKDEDGPDFSYECKLV